MIKLCLTFAFLSIAAISTGQITTNQLYKDTTRFKRQPLYI